MAEVQTNTQSGEMAQRFIEFVMMHAQNAALFLGQIPNPQTGEAQVNLEFAKMFIDQLVMIQEKTRGNLSNDEATILRNTLANLQLAFVEASEAEKGGAASTTVPQSSEPEQQAQTAAAKSSGDAVATPATDEAESRKKFTKSYGA